VDRVALASLKGMLTIDSILVNKWDGVLGIINDSVVDHYKPGYFKEALIKFVVMANIEGKIMKEVSPVSFKGSLSVSNYFL